MLREIFSVSPRFIPQQLQLRTEHSLALYRYIRASLHKFAGTWDSERATDESVRCRADLKVQTAHVRNMRYSKRKRATPFEECVGNHILQIFQVCDLERV